MQQRRKSTKRWLRKAHSDAYNIWSVVGRSRCPPSSLLRDSRLAGWCLLYPWASCNRQYRGELLQSTVEADRLSRHYAWKLHALGLFTTHPRPFQTQHTNQAILRDMYEDTKGYITSIVVFRADVQILKGKKEGRITTCHQEQTRFCISRVIIQKGKGKENSYGMALDDSQI